MGAMDTQPTTHAGDRAPLPTPTCPVCRKPAHAGESDDLNRHAACQADLYLLDNGGVVCADHLPRTSGAMPMPSEDAADFTCDHHGCGVTAGSEGRDANMVERLSRSGATVRIMQPLLLDGRSTMVVAPAKVVEIVKRHGCTTCVRLVTVDGACFAPAVTDVIEDGRGDLWLSAAWRAWEKGEMELVTEVEA